MVQGGTSIAAYARMAYHSIYRRPAERQMMRASIREHRWCSRVSDGWTNARQQGDTCVRFASIQRARPSARTYARARRRYVPLVGRGRFDLESWRPTRAATLSPTASTAGRLASFPAPVSRPACLRCPSASGASLVTTVAQTFDHSYVSQPLLVVARYREVRTCCSIVL